MRSEPINDDEVIATIVDPEHKALGEEDVRTAELPEPKDDDETGTRSLKLNLMSKPLKPLSRKQG